MGNILAQIVASHISAINELSEHAAEGTITIMSKQFSDKLKNGWTSLTYVWHWGVSQMVFHRLFYWS